MKYEYLFPVFSGYDTAETREAEFNKLGAEGWYYSGIDNIGNHVFIRQQQETEQKVHY